MAVLVDCPSCNRKLRVPDNLLGKQVKCPSCGSLFMGAAAAPAPPQAAAPVPVSASVAVTPAAPAAAPEPPGPTPDETRCPYCAEPIAADETHCPYCKTDLEGDEEERPWERPRPRRRFQGEPHRGPLVLVFGIISVALAPASVCCGVMGVAGAGIALGLGIAAWVMGRRDLQKMAAGQMDPQGRSQTNGGMICGIIGTMLGCLAIVGLAVFFGIYFGFAIWSAQHGGASPF